MTLPAAVNLAALLLRGADAWPVALGALALVGLALALLYPPQVREVGRRWQWVLPALRGAALAALAVCLVKPVVTRTRTVEEEGTVAVLLDQSASMGVADRSLEGVPDARRAIGQAMALAEALGRLPAGARRIAEEDLSREVARLEALADELARARQEIEYARVAGRDARTPQQTVVRANAEIRELSASARAQLPRGSALSRALGDLAGGPGRESEGRWVRRVREAVEDARREAEATQDRLDEELYRTNPEVQAACDETAAMSRLMLGWEALAGGEGSLLGRLDRRTPVAGFAVGDGVRPLDLRDARLGALSGGREPLMLSPEEMGADLVGAVRRVLQQYGRVPLQAVVLFSDGRQVGGTAGEPGSVLPSGVPVFTVFSAARGARDLAVDRLEVPESIFEGEPLPIRAFLSATNIDPAAVTGEATLEIEGTHAASASLAGRDRRLGPLDFELRQLPAGVHRIRLTLPAQAGEATVLNNRAERWVKVLSQRLRIALISGSPNWDHRFVRDALGRAGFVRLTESLIAPGGACDLTPAQILSQDLLILTDLGPDSLSVPQWDAVVELVRDGGGSVIVVPGLSHAQHEWGENVMSELFPYPLSIRPSWQTWPGESPHYHAAAGGERWGDWSAPGAGDDSPERRWDELAGFYRFLQIPRPNPDARVLLAERSTQAPLLTEVKVGFGRSFFLATNETWRWRRRVGDRDHERFWFQLVRHALGEPYTRTKNRLSMDLDRIVVSPEQAVRVRAKLAPRDDVAVPQQSPSPTLDLFVFRNRQFHSAGVLEPVDEARGGRYAAMLGELPPGDYEVVVSVPASEGSQFEELSMPLRVGRAIDAELADVSGDRRLLEQIADATGGRCIELEQVGTLPELLSQARQQQTRVTELPLWQSHHVFLFVLGCLSLEWAMRKRLGLT